MMVAIIVWPNLSIAVPDIDRRPEFVVGGLSFFCSDCETKGVGPTGEELCEIESNGTRSLETCSQAIVLLLREAVERRPLTSPLSGSPTVAELTNALVHRSPIVSAPAVQLILQLLVSSGEGEKALTERLELVANGHATDLISAFDIWKDHGNIVRAIWKLPPRTDNSPLTTLRMLAAVATEELGIDAIVGELGAEPTAVEAGKLLSWAKMLNDVTAGSTAPIPTNDPKSRHEIVSTAEDLTELSRAIDRCQQGMSNRAAPAFCKLDPNIPPQILKHLEKYRLKILLEHAEQLSPENFLLLLSQADLANHRTPETLLAARKALTQLTAEDSLIPPQLLDGAGREMLLLLAQSDVDLAATVAKVITNAASTQFNLGEFDKGVGLVEQSLRVYPSMLEIRRSLLEAMLRTSAVRNNSRWYTILAELSARSGSKPRTIWPWLVGILVAAGLFFAFKRVRVMPANGTASETADAEKHEGLNPIERAELRTLLSFFGLPGYADEEALSAEYRQKAKIMHPDSETGEHEDFVQLREKYERAKSLIVRR